MSPSDLCPSGYPEAAYPEPQYPHPFLLSETATAPESPNSSAPGGRCFLYREDHPASDAATAFDTAAGQNLFPTVYQYKCSLPVFLIPAALPAAGPHSDPNCLRAHNRIS